MTYGPTFGALTVTTLGRSTAPPRRSMPTQGHRGLASRAVTVCTALAIVVMLAFATGFASSASASVAVVSHGPTINGTEEATSAPTPKASVAVVTHGPTINGTDEATADQPLRMTGGPRLSGLRESPDVAAAPSEESGFPWAAAAIGSVVALGLTGLAISRARSRTRAGRTGPAALSH